MSWGGEGRGCNGSTGWLIIDSVTYDGQTLTGVDLQFEQHCEYFAAALHGEIHWDADDATSPPGPVLPLPSELWEPSAGSTPATGNYVYLDSQQGDYIGIGGEYLYTQPDSTISVNAADGYLSVFVGGNEEWYGDFQVMNVLTGLEVGYYPDLRRYPFHNAAGSYALRSLGWLVLAAGPVGSCAGRCARRIPRSIRLGGAAAFHRLHRLRRGRRPGFRSRPPPGCG